MRASIVRILLLSGATGVLPALAQTVPDAGALRQQLDNEHNKPQLPPRAAPLQVPEPPVLTLPEGATVTVKAFRFEGNTLVADAVLQAVVQRWKGRAIGFADLQRAAQDVATAYRDAGWIVRTYLPQQDVTEGTVTIHVVEAKFSGAHLEGTPPLRMSPELVIAVVQAAQAPGEPVNAAALDRGLLLASDLPGVAVSGALESGTNDGETGLALRMTDEPLVTGSVALDNGGARSTGAARVLASATVSSPLHQGDQLHADVVDSQGSHYGRVAYTTPFPPSGLRAGLNASQLDYHLVGPSFSALHAQGSSTAFGADFDYPLVRSRQRNLYLSLNGEHTFFLNRANGAVQSRYAVDSATLGLAGNAFDDADGGGANTFSFNWEHGDVVQGAHDPGENPAVAGGYDKWHYALSRQQALTSDLSLYGAVNGQYARRPLDSSSRFYLGGPTGVRAYPVNEGSGDRGQVASVELRWHALDAFSLTGFGDLGHVGDSTGDETLKGFGVTLAWSGPSNFNAQATVARRYGDNPDHGAGGKDQDGSLERTRVWLQAQLPF